MSDQNDIKAQAHVKTLLVVSRSKGFGQDQLPKVLQTPKIVVQAIKTNLADAIAAVQAEQPDLILVGNSFSDQPQFAVFQQLICDRSIHWMTFPEIPGHTHLSRNEHPASADQRDVSTTETQHMSPNPPTPRPPKNALVLIGTSTGGVEALSTILGDYPANCPPTLIVQHTGEIFGDGLIQVLQGTTQINVVKATHNLDLKPGMVCIAAGGKSHLRLAPKEQSRIELKMGAKISGHIPSIDALFHSATHVAKSVVAGVLTGMGKDGVDGLGALRKAGAKTFSQDEASSTVYGMPKLAWTTGAAQQQVSLEHVTSHIMNKATEIEMAGLV